MTMMIETRPTTVSALSEKDLQRQINLSVSRALVDRDYAAMLLADPTRVLEDRGCAPQHYKELRGIRAADISDFCQQALGVFWPTSPLAHAREDQLSFAVAAR